MLNFLIQNYWNGSRRKQGSDLYAAIEKGNYLKIKSIISKLKSPISIYDIKPLASNEYVHPMSLALNKKTKIFKYLFSRYKDEISFEHHGELIRGALFHKKKELIKLYTSFCYEKMPIWIVQLLSDQLAQNHTRSHMTISELYEYICVNSKNRNVIMNALFKLAKHEDHGIKLMAAVVLRTLLKEAIQSTNIHLVNRIINGLHLNIDMFNGFLLPEAALEALKREEIETFNRILKFMDEGSIEYLFSRIAVACPDVQSGLLKELIYSLSFRLISRIVNKSEFYKSKGINIEDVPRVLSVITAAPFGTMGDISNACKLMRELIQKNPRLVINWIVININSPNLNLTPFVSQFNERNLKFIELQGVDELSSKHYPIVKEYLLKSELIISVPTHHWLKSQSNFLYRLGRPILSITEYDFIEYDEMKHATKFLPAINQALTLQTGLNNKALGVYVEENMSSRETMLDAIDSVLSNQQHPDYAAVRKIFRSDSTQGYFENSNLYFGYLNVLQDGLHKDNGTSPSEFILSALLKEKYSNNDKANIDFAIRYDVNQHNLDELHALVDKAREFGMKLYVEYSGLKSQVSYCVGDQEQSDYHIRIINPFGLTKEVFRALQVISDPFCALTGDQSFSEGLDKIFFYQIMRWKKRLFDSFLEVIHDVVGVDSLLYEFYSMQSKGAGLHLKFQKFLAEKRNQYNNANEIFDSLYVQADKVAEFIRTHKNLNKNLPDSIFDVMNNPISLIEKMGEKLIDSKQDINLFAGYYPDALPAFCKLLEEKEILRSFGLGIREENLDPGIKKGIYALRIKDKLRNQPEKRNRQIEGDELFPEEASKKMRIQDVF